MTRRNRLAGLGVIGMAAVAWGCGGGGNSGSDSVSAADVEDLRKQVQDLSDSLKKEKERLRTYFDSAGVYDKAAYGYWSRLADAVCQIEARMPTLPPTQDRMCPKTGGGGTDKIAPPPYPPR
jgi:hypothetical protein